MVSKHPRNSWLTLFEYFEYFVVKTSLASFSVSFRVIRGLTFLRRSHLPWFLRLHLLFKVRGEWVKNQKITEKWKKYLHWIFNYAIIYAVLTARVVKWHTRMLEVHVERSVGVRVPPRAPSWETVTWKRDGLFVLLNGVAGGTKWGTLNVSFG